jgi:hypothetical protein
VNSNDVFGKWVLGQSADPTMRNVGKIPRIVILFFEYLGFGLVSYLSLKAFGTEADLRAASRAYGYWIAYGSFFVAFLTGRYLQYFYKSTNFQKHHLFQTVKERWSNGVVKTFWLSLAVTLIALLIGTLLGPGYSR